jgi:sirohydrochlorin ferrochelatase
MTDRLATIGVFATAALLVLAGHLLGRVRPDLVADLPTVFERLMARRATRVAVVLAWAWVGWHFLVTPPQ